MGHHWPPRMLHCMMVLTRKMMVAIVAKMRPPTLVQNLLVNSLMRMMKQTVIEHLMVMTGMMVMMATVKMSIVQN